MARIAALLVASAVAAWASIAVGVAGILPPDDGEWVSQHTIGHELAVLTTGLHVLVPALAVAAVAARGRRWKRALAWGALTAALVVAGWAVWTLAVFSTGCSDSFCD